MELGSEFSLGKTETSVKDNIFYYLNQFQAVYTDSGRSATRLLASLLPPGPVLMPAYICDSVLSCFPDRPVRFYKLTEDLRIDCSSLLRELDGTAILYLHFFNGVLPESRLLQILKAEKEQRDFTILEDTTHSIFSSPLTVGDYGVCSLRKWFPVPDGGVLYGRKLKGLSAEGLSEAPWAGKKAHAMALKAAFLAGEQGEACNAEYRRMFQECDLALDEQVDVCKLSEISRRILAAQSVSRLVAARKQNFAYLKRNLTGVGYLSLAEPSEGDCPLTFPIRVADGRDTLRQYLISKKIYCAIHWPLQGTPIEDAGLAQVAKEELSLPIDQRYGRAELDYLVDYLKQYRGKKREYAENY